MARTEKSRREFVRDSALISLAVLLSGLGGGMMTACESKSGSGAGSGSKAGPIRLGIWAGTQTLWRYLAQEQAKLFKPLGYDVAFQNLGSEDDLRAEFLDGRIDVIATLPAQLPFLVDSGAQVQFFAPISWMKEGYPLVVPTTSPASTIVDLQGRTVATFPIGTPGIAYWRALVLANYGFKIEEKVHLVEGAEPDTLLESGQADGAIIASPAWASLRTAGKYRLISDLASEWRKASLSDRLLMYGGLAAHKEWIGQHQQFVEDCIRAVSTAVESYQKDKTAILDAATKYAGDNVPQLTLEANAAIGTYLGLDDTPPDRAYISQADVDDHKRLFALLAKTDYLKSEPKNVDDMFYLSNKRPK